MFLRGSPSGSPSALKAAGTTSLSWWLPCAHEDQGNPEHGDDRGNTGSGPRIPSQRDRGAWPAGGSGPSRMNRLADFILAGTLANRGPCKDVAMNSRISRLRLSSMPRMQCGSEAWQHRWQGGRAESGCTTSEWLRHEANRAGEFGWSGEPSLGWQEITTLGVPTAAEM